MPKSVEEANKSAPPVTPHRKKTPSTVTPPLQISSLFNARIILVSAMSIHLDKKKTALTDGL